MSDGLFDPPVFVKIRKHLVQQVVSISEAIDVLDEWPADKRDVLYETVRRACFEAQDGLRPVEVARKAFTRFAERAGMTADPKEIMPLMGSNAKMRRRLPV